MPGLIALFVWVTADPAPLPAPSAVPLPFAAFCTLQHNCSPTEMDGSGGALRAASFDHPQLFGSLSSTIFEKAEGLRFIKLLIL